MRPENAFNAPLLPPLICPPLTYLRKRTNRHELATLPNYANVGFLVLVKFHTWSNQWGFKRPPCSSRPSARDARGAKA